MCGCNGQSYYHYPEPIQIEEKPPVSRKIEPVRRQKQAVSRRELVLVPVKDTFVSDAKFRERLRERKYGVKPPNPYMEFTKR